MNLIKVTGKFEFDPPNMTKKHVNQSEWKTTAILQLTDNDICAYYAWFIKKRHGLELLRPQRGPHVTIMADRTAEIKNWDSVRKKYNGTYIDIKLDLDARTDGKTWWLNVYDKPQLQNIRNEAGLGTPFFGLHMTIGNVWDKHLEHGKYIHTLYKNNYAY